MRGYELIYPCSDPEKNALFDKMLQKSNDIWDEFTTGKLRHKQRLNEALNKKKDHLMNSTFKPEQKKTNQ